MDEIADVHEKIRRLADKQEEIILRLNQVIERVNEIPRDFKEARKKLEKRTVYLEEDIERLKHKANVPDEDI